MHCYQLSTLIILMAMSSIATANTWQANNLQINTPAQTKSADSGTVDRGLTINQDDITSDQDSSKIQLTAAQIHQALVWDLTSEQEQRYVYLLQNKTGLQYQGQHLSPVWILGLNARTDVERNYYAKLAAEQEARYVAQNLAWNNAYTDAYRELTSGIPVIKPFDFSKYSPTSHQNVVWQNGDVVNLFIKSSDAVGAIMANLMAALTTYPGMTLNVFFIDDTNPASMQTWANQQSLPTPWVMTKRITLNNGDAQYNNITFPNKKTPLLILVRNNQAQAIDTGVL